MYEQSPVEGSEMVVEGTVHSTAWILRRGALVGAVASYVRLLFAFLSIFLLDLFFHSEFALPAGEILSVLFFGLVYSGAIAALAGAAIGMLAAGLMLLYFRYMPPAIARHRVIGGAVCVFTIQLVGLSFWTAMALTEMTPQYILSAPDIYLPKIAHALVATAIGGWFAWRYFERSAI